MPNINAKFIAMFVNFSTYKLFKLVCLIDVTKATQTKTVMKISIKKRLIKKRKFCLGNKYNMKKKKKKSYKADFPSI